jgi:hypothetical protein
MRDHALMPAQGLNPEDYDYIDESDFIQANEARPVRGDEVSVKLLVPLTHDEFVAFDALASEREDNSIIAAARDAIREYVAAHAGRPAAPQRRAG